MAGTETAATAFTTAKEWNDLWAESGEGASPTVRSDDDISVATIPHPTRGDVPVVSVRCSLPKRVWRDVMVRNGRAESMLARRIGASALALTPGPRQEIIVIRFVPGPA